MDKQKQIEQVQGDIKVIIQDTIYSISNDDDRKYLAEILYDAGYRKASEVAEEIFEAIEEKIDLELSIIRKIIHAEGGRTNGKTVLLGKIQMIIDLKNFIAELKKKYTEEGK